MSAPGAAQPGLDLDAIEARANDLRIFNRTEAERVTTLALCARVRELEAENARLHNAAVTAALEPEASDDLEHVLERIHDWLDAPHTTELALDVLRRVELDVLDALARRKAREDAQPEVLAAREDQTCAARALPSETPGERPHPPCYTTRPRAVMCEVCGGDLLLPSSAAEEHEVDEARTAVLEGRLTVEEAHLVVAAMAAILVDPMPLHYREIALRAVRATVAAQRFRRTAWT